MKHTPTLLVILDGLGHRAAHAHNAVYHADTPYLDHIGSNFPHTLLQASGTAVGLPEGFMGNSEVGHMTIGAGRIIKQPITRLHELIDAEELSTLPALQSAFEKIKKRNGRLHLIGLLSDAGVHSHTKHFFAFLKAAIAHGITDIFVHPFLDGRDTPPRSAANYLGTLEQELKQIGHGTIGSLHGRFYAMDRDTNWERTEQSFQVLTGQNPVSTIPWKEALSASYDRDELDEFVRPMLLESDAAIRDGDGILFTNFRPDRARQLTRCFVDPNAVPLELFSVSLSCFITPVAYDHLSRTTHLLDAPMIKDTLKDVIATAGKRIFTIAETEKYAHVTYFFTGGREDAVPGETRELVPSIPRRDYAACPEMSAAQITTRVLESLQNDPHDFYLINYANADMVAHSGDFDATVKAIQFLDQQLAQLHEQVIEKMGGRIVVTADHGNAEDMFDEESKQPRTAHTANQVPCFVIGQTKPIQMNQLSQIAPLVLHSMNLPIPEQMKIAEESKKG